MQAGGLAAWEILRTLVAFDTTSRESNLALIDWVRGWLADHGVEATLTYDDDRRKANLFATLPARDGNAVTGGIVLSGHTDVVPVDGQPWTRPPFTATPEGDRVYGRGVADMKGFCATALAMVPEFARRSLARPLHLALSYDEEVGCIGVRRLIADIDARGVRPLGCIVGEPTGNEIVVAHKGKKSWRCRVRGREAHSALTPLGVNAVEIACDIVSRLSAMARARRDGGPFDGGYDVAYTTLHTGTIRGGTALNIVPRCVRVRDPPPALRRPRRAVPRNRSARPDAAAGDAGGRSRVLHRVRPAVDDAGLRSRARQRDRRARPRLQRTRRRRQGVVRQRGVALPRGSDPDGPVRTGAHRAGAPARRVGGGRRARRLRGVHAPARRPDLQRMTPTRPARPGAQPRHAGAGVASRPPPIEVPFPDLGRWAAGNSGVPFVHTLTSAVRGPHVLLQALTHGNEVCGAIALDWLLGTGFVPQRGTLSVVFANVAAYASFDPAHPFASRCLDEDFNRLWTSDVLDSDRRSADLDRARQLRPLYDRVDHLLDLHCARASSSRWRWGRPSTS